MLNPPAVSDVSLGILDGPLQLEVCRRILQILEAFDRKENGNSPPFPSQHHRAPGLPSLPQDIRHLGFEVGEGTEILAELHSSHS